jgi:probable addiction module antidote protein
MTEAAEKAGVSRENLYRALGGDVKPEFDTIMKVLHALGISLVAQAQPQNTPRAA